MKRKIPFYLILSVALILMAGCSVKQQVLKDGIPMPNTTYVARSATTQIRVEAFVAQMVEKQDSDEGTYLYPADYLNINQDEVFELPSDTAKVQGKIRVVNPLRKKYTLRVSYEVHYPELEWPYRISRIVYIGDSREKTFNVGRKVEDSHPRVKCRMAILQGEKRSMDEKAVLFNLRTEYQVKD